MNKPIYEPTGWWRSLLKDGTLWTESSDEEEVRRHVSRAPKDKFPVYIQRHMRRVEEKWEDVQAIESKRSSKEKK